jgi:hypothetical protein
MEKSKKEKFPQLIAMYKKMSAEARVKALDVLIEMKLITKTDYKKILKECLEKK